MNVLKKIRVFNEVVGGVSFTKFSSGVHARTLCHKLDQTKPPAFFNDEVQNILKSLTRIDFNKVFRPQKLGKKISDPELKFMTDQELKEAQEEARKKTEMRLQMPPVLPPRTEIDHVLVKDTKLKDFSTSKYVFTDITFGKDDRTRHIVVRDVDGTLRKASWRERERSNEIYFPRPGRKLRTPQMFKPGHFEDVLNKGSFLFILERACAQFEPDDPLYISVMERTYDKIAETKRFQDLESTRFFGPMIYYYTQKKKLAPLLVYFFSYDRLEDVLKVIKLHCILHAQKEFSTAVQTGNELSIVKNFIADHYSNDAELELALKSYEDYLTKPKSQAAI